MRYEAELSFLRDVLGKLHIQTMVLSAQEMPKEHPDFGLRSCLGRKAEYEQEFLRSRGRIRENTIYKMADGFFCHYVYFLLPEGEEQKVLLVGPYTVTPMNKQQIMEVAEETGVPAGRLHQLESYYENVPVLEDTTTLFVMIHAFAERVWGGENAYEMVDVDREVNAGAVLQEDGKDGEDILMRMKIMETRYAYENELMDMVARGMGHRAEMMLSGNLEIRFEQRSTDPLRNLKNYGVICNTLLRKAAERGGVHPFHLDGMSSSFAREIEAMTNRNAGDILTRMVRSYSRLVRKHAVGHYSPLIQKTVTCIESDLRGKLGLKELAELQGISPGYLSTLFRKETGRTLTDYVAGRRVDYARQLLGSTKLQVQTIAQYCGIPDVNYFSKTFKKYTGITPVEFRAQLRYGNARDGKR